MSLEVKNIYLVKTKISVSFYSCLPWVFHHGDGKLSDATRRRISWSSEDDQHVKETQICSQPGAQPVWQV